MRRAEIPFETRRLCIAVFRALSNSPWFFLVRIPTTRFSQTTIKKEIKMEEAEELKAKLEAVGATVEIV